MAITNVKEYDILPSRWDYFERRMEKLKEAAGRKIPPIEFNYTKTPVATTRPLDALLIPRAMNNQVPDARQLSNGQWVRDVLPVKIEYGDLINPKFDYIGYVNYGQVKNTAGDLKKGIFPYIAKDAAMSDEDHEKRVASMTPRLQALGEQWSSTKSVKCELCNPKGDEISRHTAYIVQAKEDVKQDTKKSLKGQQPQLNLKKGEIIQLGSACLSDFMGLDVDKIAAFYELDREVGSYGPNGSPSNPAGWGYKEMGVYDYAERLVMFYGQREKEYLNGVGKSLWELPNPNEIYNHGTLSNLMGKKSKLGSGSGCFVGAKSPTAKNLHLKPFHNSKAQFLQKGRVFNLNEDDLTKKPQWMFQSYGSGSMKNGNTTPGSLLSFGWDASKNSWLQALNNDYDYQTVMVVNESDGTPILDPTTGDIMEIEVKVPSLSFIRKMLQGHNTRNDWKKAIIPIMPPSAESEYTKNTVNRMMNWIKTLDVNSSEYKGMADLLVRLKSTVQIGYVGDKTIGEAPQIWRLFMLHDFKRRQRQDYKNQRKQIKETMSKLLEPTYPNGKWFTVKNLSQNRDMTSYMMSIYNKGGRKYGYYANQNLYRAKQDKYDMVYLTQAQMDGFTAYVAKIEADRKAREEEQKKYYAYQQIVRDIANKNRYERTSARQIPYDPDVQEFLKVLGWEALGQDLDRLSSQGSSLIRFNQSNNTVSYATITDSQLDKVKAAFRPQLVTQAGIYNPAAQPQPVTVSKPKTMPKITQSAAKSLLGSNRPTNWKYPKGDVLPEIEGYCAMVSRPFYRRGMGSQGRTITMNNKDNEVFVFFYYGTKIPEVGNYYRVVDVEVTQHSEYKGLKQMVVEDIDGGQVEFINITS
jgi:hypothetical protein